MFGPKRRKVGREQFAYGDIDGERTTIHGTREVNVEVDAQGRVMAVWFRCMLLPFTYDVIDRQRAIEMMRAYQGKVLPVDAIIFAENRLDSRQGVHVPGPPLFPGFREGGKWRT